MADLTRALAPGSYERLFAVVRLYGLHNLSERLGPVAQDQLLERAHRRLLLEVGPAGVFYLPRRDELCVLFECPLDEALRVLDKVTAGLNELGADGEVTAEAGVALLPDEAADPISALERADRRIFPGEYTGWERGIVARRGRRNEDQQMLRVPETRFEVVTRQLRTRG